MNNKNNVLDGSTSLRVRRGRVESVDLYEIKDTELDSLEKGTPAELQLNFAVFLLSTSFAAISTLLTATFPNKTTETIFIVVSVVGLLIGIYLLIAWARTRSDVKKLCQRIRQRIPQDVALPIASVDSDEEPPEVGDPEVAPAPKG